MGQNKWQHGDRLVTQEVRSAQLANTTIRPSWDELVSPPRTEGMQTLTTANAAKKGYEYKHVVIPLHTVAACAASSAPNGQSGHVSQSLETLSSRLLCKCCVKITVFSKLARALAAQLGGDWAIQLKQIFMMLDTIKHDRNSSIASLTLTTSNIHTLSSQQMHCRATHRKRFRHNARAEPRCPDGQT